VVPKEVTMRTPSRTSAVLALATVVAVGAGGAFSALGTPAPRIARSSQSESGPDLPVLPLPRPRDFVERVSNQYLPLTPGTRWVYAGHGAERGERNVVRVLRRTRVIEGIDATVVHDVVREDGELVEDTYDWYAQDRLGNVWYLGERTRELEDGHVVSREGSWEAGVGDARAGIAMPAAAEPGTGYRQEFDPGNAEDQAQVMLRHGQVHVPAGHFGGVRVTDETTPLEPRVDELKFYARGVGVVLELGTSPQLSRSVLTKMDKR
jgi:hypothetical protein